MYGCVYVEHGQTVNQRDNNRFIHLTHKTTQSCACLAPVPTTVLHTFDSLTRIIICSGFTQYLSQIRLADGSIGCHSMQFWSAYRVHRMELRFSLTFEHFTQLHWDGYDVTNGSYPIQSHEISLRLLTGWRPQHKCTCALFAMFTFPTQSFLIARR